jgi:endoglucanase
VVGANLLSQPHGAASWGEGSPATDWNVAAQETAAWLLERHPEYRGLVLVEAVGEPAEPRANWGGDLRGAV